MEQKESESCSLSLAVLNCMLDPISFELMADPVFTDDNITYDRDSILSWFNSCDKCGKRITSPVTNKVLRTQKLRPNLALRGVIEATAQSLLKTRDERGVLSLGRLNELLDHYLEAVKGRILPSDSTEKLSSNDSIFIEDTNITDLRSHCPTCMLGHRMELVQQRLPVGYTSVCCDSCGLRGLEQARGPYFNCLTCQYDLCDTCAILMHMQDEMSLFERLMVPLSDRRDGSRDNDVDNTNNTNNARAGDGQVQENSGLMGSIIGRLRRVFSGGR